MKIENAKEEKTTHPPCPTCNEEWDGDANFCYWCGYQEIDDANPLHPLPKLVDGVSDVAGILTETELAGLKSVIASTGKGRPVMFATFATPDDQTPAGVAYAMHNGLTIGLEGADNGLLIFLDKSRKRVELVLGRNLGRASNPETLKAIASDFAADVTAGRLVEGFDIAVDKILKP